MASSPQPVQPPRKPERHILRAALLVIALIVACGIFMVWLGLCIVSRSVHVKVAETRPDRKVVTVKTPVGDFKITKGRSVGDFQLGLPVYPGATRQADSGDDNSVSISFDLPDQTDLRIAAAKFTTPDAISKVQAFYRQQLGGDVTTFTRTDRNGKVVFEIKYGEQRKIVSLRPRDGGTQIKLVRIFKGHDEPN